MLGLRARHTRREPRLGEEAVEVALVEHVDTHQLVRHRHRDVEGRREDVQYRRNSWPGRRR